MKPENLCVDLFSDEIQKLIHNAPTYKKVVVINYRIAEPEESLDAVLSDGTMETQRILTGGEYIITTPSGEEYALSEEKFRSRYTQEENGSWVSTGLIKAVPNPTGEAITIMAPWREFQNGKADCLIAQACENLSDRYLIDKEAFDLAYVAV